jgi:hypothetical protein
MSLNKNEKLLVEAIDSMLQQDAMLGLSIHVDDHESMGTAERGYEYLHNQIDEMFAVKSAELIHADAINQAFKKVHNYKYLDDPSFKTAMQKEMVAQAVPAEERAKALEFLPKIISELKAEQAEWAEKDSFNPNLDEIMEVSQPEQPLDFNIESVDGWSNEANIEWEKGNASPARTPMDKDVPYPKDA